MANVEIYTWSTCPFCRQAKQLLDKKGVNYSEYALDGALIKTHHAGALKLAVMIGTLMLTISHSHVLKAK